MIVVMEKGATPDQVEHMVQRVEELGLKSHVIYGTERTVIAAVGEEREHTRLALESGPGVENVVPILAPYKMASREVQPEPTHSHRRVACTWAADTWESSRAPVAWRARNRSSVPPRRSRNRAPPPFEVALSNRGPALTVSKD